MKSRLSILLILACGFVVSGTGGALAISGSSGEVSAAQNQYCPPGSTNPDYCQPCPPGSTNPDYCQPCPPGTLNPDYCPYGENPYGEGATTTPGPTVAGETEEQADDPKSSGSDPAQETAAVDPPAAAVQTARQSTSDANGNLPFTGFAAIPVIFVGFALLLTGALLQRQSRRQG